MGKNIYIGDKDSLFYGTLLGDAWLWKSKKNDYVFRFEHSNHNYSIWKAEFIGVKYKVYTRERYDKRTNKTYYSTTIDLGLGVDKKKELLEIFYKPKKVVTEKMLNKLDKNGILLWYLDDGSIYYNGNNCHLTLSVNGFNDNERLLIIKYFKNRHGINFKINGKAIRLTSRKECEKFMFLVEDKIPKCMEYKKLSNQIDKHKKKPNKVRKNIVSRKVLQLNKKGEIIKIWSSVNEISEKLNINKNNIYCNLCGKSKYCLNSNWVYKK